MEIKNKKNFKISDFFEVVGTKSLDEGYLDFIENGINFVGRVNENNGIKGQIAQQNFAPNESNTITATVIGNYKYVKYQEEPYYCSQNINKLVPKFKINKKIALYFMAYINKFISQFNGQQGGYRLEQLQNHSILIPINEKEQPDYKFMEDYISELEEERISELEEERISELSAYLKVSGLEDYHLTPQEKEAIQKFKYIKTKKFKLGEGEKRLFDITTTKKKFNANCIKFGGKYPYVARSNVNNGIRGYITEDEQYLNNANTISFGQDTATMFYQEKPYFTGDKIKIMTYKEKTLDKNLACYLITMMKKAFQNFSWGQSSFNETILKNIEIEMPITDIGNIDYDFIETFINAQQKLAIKSVVDWRDKEIKTTKKII